MVELSQLNTVGLFTGPHRSGSTLFAAIIDSHPNARCANETGRSGVYIKLGEGAINGSDFLERIVKESNTPNLGDRVVVRPAGEVLVRQYRYEIEKIPKRGILSICDASGPWFGRGTIKNPKVALEAKKQFGGKLRVLTIVRNPWDNFATMKLLGQSIGLFEAWCRGTAAVSTTIDSCHEIFHLEDLIFQPEQTIQKLCDFLSIPFIEEHIKAWEKKIWKKPHKRATSVEWKQDEIDVINRLIDDLPWMARYRNLDG